MTERGTRPGAGLDRLLGFTHSRPPRARPGRRLGPVLDRILAAHDYPPAIQQLLAEALVLTALMGGLLKREGSQLTMQAQTEGGVVELLVCDYRDGELRGYVKHDRRAARRARRRSVARRAVRQGLSGDHLRSRRRPTSAIRASCRSKATSLAEAVEAYFAQSEQVPTLIRTAVASGRRAASPADCWSSTWPRARKGASGCTCGRIIPNGSMSRSSAQSVRHEELVDPELSLEALVWRLFHEEREVRVQAPAPLSRGCRCSVVHFEEVLARFPEGGPARDARRERASSWSTARSARASFPFRIERFVARTGQLAVQPDCDTSGRLV